MMITHYNRKLILSNQLSVGYIPICMQILDLSRRNWQMGGKNTWKMMEQVKERLAQLR